MTCVTLPLLTVPAAAAQRQAASHDKISSAEVASEMADVRRFIEQLTIPYETFTLSNGLRVVVHEDHSVPKVHVNVTYDVGSKHEPAGRSGFAHLFEHLMFNGSENVPGEYMSYLNDVGGEVNGNTSSDRTQYFENVPAAALERALFMESDRMGRLLGALDQKTLDEQRGVVQNEKRNGAASRLSIMNYKVRTTLYPPGHPYHTSTIGSMADLNAADLDDVRSFFKEHYGPNNAVLVLAGDVDMPTARRLVTKYFGGIPAGPRNVRPVIVPTPMARTISETVTAPVDTATIVRAWPVAGYDQRDGYVLDAISEVWAGGADDPLSDSLVHKQKLFSRVSASNASAVQGGEFTVRGTLREGVDLAVAAAALDREIEKFLKTKVAPEAISRYVARFTYPYVKALDNATSRGALLAETMSTHRDPAAYKTDLRVYSSQTPDTIMATARKWLNQPRYELTITPGPRVIPKEDEGIDGSVPSAPAQIAKPVTAAPQVMAQRDRLPLPAVAPPGDAPFPPIERARLTNGIPVLYAQKKGVPFTNFNLNFKGDLTDAEDYLATTFMYDLLGSGSAGHSEEWLNRRKELLGIYAGGAIGVREGSILMNGPDVNIGDGFGMVRDMLVSPDFAAKPMNRMKIYNNDMTRRNRLDVSTLTEEALMPLFDPASPYNRINKSNTAAEINAVDRNRVSAAFKRWIRPEYASITVISDKPLAELMPMMEKAIGSWTVAGKAPAIPPIDYRPKPGAPVIVLIDLPGAVQANIVGRQVTSVDYNAPSEELDMANYVLGGGFGSRLNMNLREDKHWAYGASGSFESQRYGSHYSFSADVQQDKAGPAIAEVIKEIKAITSDHPITEKELVAIKGLALGATESSLSSREGIMYTLEDMRRHNFPDNYAAQTSARQRAVTLAGVNAALRTQLLPDRWVWAIVGNAAIIRPQLDALGIPVKVLKAEEIAPKP
ncbi:M16 family metallopeptidase [Sphingomonas mollis]|nr:pitrilysin family protein [Sphingomonas sp. BT553]